MRSRRPAAPNRIAEVEVAWWDADAESGDATVAVPVVAMRLDALETWARAVVAGSAWVDAVWARQPLAHSAREANADASAEDRVRAFQARASHGALALARVLAGAPVLSWPLIRVLQARLLPGTGSSELAEVLVSGLLERIQESAREGEGEGEQRFRFRAAVSELLARGTTALEEWDAFAAISDYLERTPAQAAQLMPS